MKRLALVVMVMLAFSACANDEEPATTPTTPGTTETSPSPTPTDGAESGTVNVATTSLGEILVGPDGRTLYLFLQDSAGTSACTGGCASTWPPLTVTGAPEAGDGADASLLDTIERDDGSMQVTYNDHPLYHYANDAGPGDTNGQGIGGNWYVVSPAGEAIQT